MEEYKNYIIMALLYLGIIFAVYFIYEAIRKRRAVSYTHLTLPTKLEV